MNDMFAEESEKSPFFSYGKKPTENTDDDLQKAKVKIQQAFGDLKPAKVSLTKIPNKK